MTEVGDRLAMVVRPRVRRPRLAARLLILSIVALAPAIWLFAREARRVRATRALAASVVAWEGEPGGALVELVASGEARAAESAVAELVDAGRGAEALRAVLDAAGLGVRPDALARLLVAALRGWERWASHWDLERGLTVLRYVDHDGLATAAAVTHDPTAYRGLLLREIGLVAVALGRRRAAELLVPLLRDRRVVEPWACGDDCRHCLTVRDWAALGLLRIAGQLSRPDASGQVQDLLVAADPELVVELPRAERELFVAAACATLAEAPDGRGLVLVRVRGIDGLEPSFLHESLERRVRITLAAGEAEREATLLGHVSVAAAVLGPVAPGPVTVSVSDGSRVVRLRVNVPRAGARMLEVDLRMGAPVGATTQ